MRRIRLICIFLQVEPVQIICAKMFAGCTLIVNIISRVAVSNERLQKSANHPSLRSSLWSVRTKKMVITQNIGDSQTWCMKVCICSVAKTLCLKLYKKCPHV